MGLNLNELSSLAGGVHEGIGDVQERRVAANQEARMQDAWGRTTQQWDRDDEQNALLGELSALLDPSKAGTQAPPPGAGSGIVPQQGQALPAPGQASPPPGTTSPAAPAGGQALPAGGQGAPSRRDQIADVAQRYYAAAAKAGGLEGLNAAREFVDFQRRGQMISLGNSAYGAINEGNAGAAAKYLNTAMEIMPTDTGVEWVAKDGKLYASRNGQLSEEPYSAEAVRAMVRDKIMDAKNYKELNQLTLDEKTQADDVRLRESGQTLYGRQISVAEAQQALAEKYKGREVQADEARALASLINARAASDRALAAVMDNPGSNLDIKDILQIYKDTDAWALEDLTAVDFIQDWMNDNPNQFTLHKADVESLMIANDGMVGRNDASLLSQAIRYDQWESKEQYDAFAQEAGIGGWAEDPETGQVRAIINGKPVVLDRGSAKVARENLRSIGVLGKGGGDKEQALPASTEGQGGETTTSSGAGKNRPSNVTNPVIDPYSAGVLRREGLEPPLGDATSSELPFLRHVL